MGGLVRILSFLLASTSFSHEGNFIVDDRDGIFASSWFFPAGYVLGSISRAATDGVGPGG